MKARLALFEESPLSSQNPKTFPPKNKGLVAETFDWDEEEVSDDEEVTQVKVLMALADDELIVGKSHAHNGEWVEIIIRKVNTLLFVDEDADWAHYVKHDIMMLLRCWSGTNTLLLSGIHWDSGLASSSAVFG
nr:retrovirus-related Pol polyprotein from transposon TNT 1-94 [Tanacetum cinerariifolium]